MLKVERDIVNISSIAATNALLLAAASE